MRTYDESELVSRLGQLDRRGKTVFAVSCAELLLPFGERFAQASGQQELRSRLAVILQAVWDAASGSEGTSDMDELRAEAERMVPTDEEDWKLETGYGQSAFAAAAYAVRTWLSDEAQEAAWAARQVYELADYAVLQASPQLDLNAARAEDEIRISRPVQLALEALWRTLRNVESGVETLERLRSAALEDGRALAQEAP